MAPAPPRPKARGTLTRAARVSVALHPRRGDSRVKEDWRLVRTLLAGWLGRVRCRPSRRVVAALALATLGVAGETAGPAGGAPAAQGPAVAGAARRLQWEVVRSGPHDP